MLLLKAVLLLIPDVNVIGRQNTHFILHFWRIIMGWLAHHIIYRATKCIFIPPFNIFRIFCFICEILLSIIFIITWLVSFLKFSMDVLSTFPFPLLRAFCTKFFRLVHNSISGSSQCILYFNLTVWDLFSYRYSLLIVN